MRTGWLRALAAACGVGLLLAAAIHAADNTPPAGFKALFNGKDLTGWKGLVGNPKSRAKMIPEALAKAQAKADELMRTSWTIVDGALEYNGKGRSLCTAKDYANFELYVDWSPVRRKGTKRSEKSQWFAHRRLS